MPCRYGARLTRRHSQMPVSRFAFRSQCRGSYDSLRHDMRQDTGRSLSRRLMRTLAPLSYSLRLLRSRLIHLVVPIALITGSLSAQASAPDGIFSDLSVQYDGGVANPTDGSTGNALQQTMLAAYRWGIAHRGARATVVVAAEYPISGSRLLVPGNVDLVCSSYTPENYSGGCHIQQTDSGNNTATGGSPLLVIDYTSGFLSDNKTRCSTSDKPQQPDCLIVNGSGASIRGFSLSGQASLAGAGDIGIQVLGSGVHVQDTNERFFGGPGISTFGGISNSFDWNFGTNVDMWWCAHPSQIRGRLGGMELQMLDGEASHNQYSTGCAFVKGSRSSLEYPFLGSMHVGGGGNLIQSNLLQADGMGLIVEGQEERILSNRVEFHSREAIFNDSWASVFSQNVILSACLDPNLANLRPGSLDGGVPLYPHVPARFSLGQILMDANGNVEQVVGTANGQSGLSDADAPDWAVTAGGIAFGNELTWMNIGPWQPGFSNATDPGSPPALVSGLCYAVNDVGIGNTWTGNLDGVEVGIGGPSFLRGEYSIGGQSVISGNKCHQDWPDAYGNGQCWWGGDLYSNGGPIGMAPNQLTITTSGGGTAWVGDYSYLVLMDTAPHHYNNFQGMSSGQHFFVGSDTATNFVDPWTGWGGTRQSFYGHPAVLTCGGVPVAIGPGAYYEFVYNPDGRHNVQQVNCPSGLSDSAIPTQSSPSLTVSPGTLVFSAQDELTPSVAQQISVTNTGNANVQIVFSVTGDFSYTSSCGPVLAGGASCVVSVTFDPSGPGARTGTLTLSDSIAGFSQTVALSGTGVDVSNTHPSVTLSSASGALQLSPGINAATADLVLTPVNGFMGNVTLTCSISAADGSMTADAPSCAVINETVSLKDGTAKALQLSVAQTHESAMLKDPSSGYLCTFRLAGLCMFGLCAIGRHKKVAAMLLIVTCMVGVTGCGYTPNANNSASFTVTVKASAGNAKASLNLPLKVQK